MNCYIKCLIPHNYDNKKLSERILIDYQTCESKIPNEENSKNPRDIQICEYTISVYDNGPREDYAIYTFTKERAPEGNIVYTLKSLTIDEKLSEDNIRQFTTRVFNKLDSNPVVRNYVHIKTRISYYESNKEDSFNKAIDEVIDSYHLSTQGIEGAPGFIEMLKGIAPKMDI